MPRPRPQTSALLTPLDFIIGTLGSVRTLRVLTTTTVPLSQSEIARRADLTSSALPGLLANLENAGVITYVGRGRTRQVLLQQRHPLTRLLAQLFREEENRWSRINDELRRVAIDSTHDLVSAWIAGPVTVRQDRFTEPLILGILSERPIDISLQEQMRVRANIVQSTEHVIVALRFYQRADLLRFTPVQLSALKAAIVLHGPSPIDLVNVGAPDTRTDLTSSLDARRRSARPAATGEALAASIADRLMKEPEILARAREHIDRRLPLAGETERLALIEWQGLLDSLTPRQIAALLREHSERADVLRQNIPFHGALSAEERNALLLGGAGALRRRP